MKYSRQRELILNYVQNSCEHPTADMVYTMVKKELPNISLGTVYRNLNQLYENNLIRKISMPGGSDRFDKTLTNHSHMYCTECRSIIDINDDVISLINNIIEEKTHHKIISNDIILTGICSNCNKK
ncbi:MAG: transcriptional repressor [Bacilli bacterium]|nr:transcriptional repressor [Bacilli bacterium]MDD4608210.1 transcriptional repressor [Bacilli bacterium]